MVIYVMLTKCLKLAALSPVASLLLVKSCYLPSKQRCSFPKKKKLSSITGVEVKVGPPEV